nr:MAG: hypothetical protein [Lokiarchaeota virus Ratatoskr Meg22_1012]
MEATINSYFTSEMEIERFTMPFFHSILPRYVSPHYCKNCMLSQETSNSTEMVLEHELENRGTDFGFSPSRIGAESVTIFLNSAEQREDSTKNSILNAKIQFSKVIIFSLQKIKFDREVESRGEVFFHLFHFIFDINNSFIFWHFFLHQDRQSRDHDKVERRGGKILFLKFPETKNIPSFSIIFYLPSPTNIVATESKGALWRCFFLFHDSPERK